MAKSSKWDTDLAFASMFIGWGMGALTYSMWDDAFWCFWLAAVPEIVTRVLRWAQRSYRRIAHSATRQGESE